MAKRPFEKGIGWVIVARFKSAGQRVEAGVFLVDVCCLGIKLAVYESSNRQDYLQRIRGHYDAPDGDSGGVRGNWVSSPDPGAPRG